MPSKATVDTRVTISSDAQPSRAELSRREGKEQGPNRMLSVTRDMSGFRSTRSVRFSPEGSHAAGGQNGPDHRCDWVASSEEVELRGGSGAAGDERAALSPVARRLRGAGRGGDCGPA